MTRVAILSDIHDNIWNLNAALRHMPATDALICCGDLCSPFVVGLLATGYAKPIHIVFGNNDGDLYRIALQASRFDHVNLHGEYFEDTFGRRRVAVTHYPDIAASIGASNNQVDVVCFGHNHRYEVRRENGVLLLNPGPIMGYDPNASLDVPATFLVYDAPAHDARGYRVEDGNVIPIN